MSNILIIGFGKAGSHLYYALKSTGSKNTLTVIKSRRTKIGRELIANADIIFLCVKDDEIKKTADSIIKSSASLKGKIAVHTSGALSSNAISSLKAIGAITASYHPVQTFSKKTKSDTGLFRNIYIAIEGDKKAVTILSKIAKDTGSVPFIIDSRLKTLHHVCCVISSNYLVTHLSVLRDIYRQKNGFKKVNFFNIYMPLIQQTLTNISTSGIERSLTGPIERGDLRTIKKHIAELETLKGQEIVDYYRFIGKKTIKIARQKGNLTKQQTKELRNLLKNKN